MKMPPWTLESLAFHWGDAFVFSYVRDKWVALRRDKRYFITADTLDELEAAIRADYEACPIPRAFDPPDTAEYLGGLEEEQEGDDTGRNDGLEPDICLILSELRQLFPLWEVTYSMELRTWLAKSKYGSFCEHSIALVWVALARMERRKIDWD